MGKPHLVYDHETAKGLPQPQVFSKETFQNGRQVCTIQERDAYLADALRWCRKKFKKAGKGGAADSFTFREEFGTFEFRDADDAALFRLFWG